jgi:Sulfotransferase family
MSNSGPGSEPRTVAAPPQVDVAAAPAAAPAPVGRWDFPRNRKGVARDVGWAAVHAVRDRRNFRDVERFLFFVGFPHSGSSLVGSLLNSHPEIVVSHEADVLRYVKPGIPRAMLLEFALEGDRRFARIGRRWMDIDYGFPGTCQGAFVRLRVVGDKKAQRSVRRVQEDPAILDRLRRTVGVPIRVLHIVRNPYDNITSMARRPEEPLSEVIDHYRGVADAVDFARSRLDSSEFLAVRYEAIASDPAGRMSEICRFIGVDAPEAYLAICQCFIHPSRGRSRDRIEWPPEARREVEDIIKDHALLAGYSFEDQVPGERGDATAESPS